MNDQIAAQGQELVVSRDVAERQIAQQVEAGIHLLSMLSDGAYGGATAKAEYGIWFNQTDGILRQLFSTDSTRAGFAECGFTPGVYRGHDDQREAQQRKQAIWNGVQRLDQILATIHSMPVRPAFHAQKAVAVATKPEEPHAGPAQIENVLRRFHRVALQLRHRHLNRATLKISSPMDAVDLLQALLRLYYDDIRREDWTPTYAADAPTVELHLRSEKMTIEVKLARRGWGEKEAAAELAFDAEHHSKSPDCKTLVCFIYDPEGRIKNPVALESKLSRTADDLNVVVVVGEG